MNKSEDILSSKVEISVSCRNLKDMDIFSKSDPMAVLYQKFEHSYYELGRTEVIKNNLNPDFAKVFEIEYHFEERQIFKIELYDCDSASTRLTDHDFLGLMEFSLGELVSRQKLEAKLNDRNRIVGKPQTVILSCQETKGSSESLVLQISGSRLDKKDLFGKSDPILELYRSNDQIAFSNEDFSNYTNFSLAYRSAPIMKTLDPSWPTFSVKINRLCCGDKDRLVKIVCTDWNASGRFDFIGQCYTSVNHLLNVRGQFAIFELINPKKKSKKNYKNSGTLTVNKSQLQIDHSFIDFIAGGTELNFMVSIDFTASNGNQNDPRSLHYIPQGGYSNSENQYEKAIISVGSIIQDYDSDKLFPALGFGARIPPNNVISHCFPINFCLENPYCAGVNGLLMAYRSAIRSIILHGPTNFAPSIRHVQKFAQAYIDGSKYFVLLIITDGIITDLDATIDAIVDCSFLPMSIIIIGVGNEDFSAMDMLDCDHGRLRSGQKVAQRDIVQFVAIRDFLKNSNDMLNQAALSKAVLFELPGQVTSWMKTNGIAPLPPRNDSFPNPMQGDLSQPTPYPLMANAPTQSAPYSSNANTPQHVTPYPVAVTSPVQGSSYPPNAKSLQQVPPYSSVANAPPMPNIHLHRGSYPSMVNTHQHAAPYPPMTDSPQHGGKYPQKAKAPQPPPYYGNPSQPMINQNPYGGQYPHMAHSQQPVNQYDPQYSSHYTN